MATPLNTEAVSFDAAALAGAVAALLALAGCGASSGERAADPGIDRAAEDEGPVAASQGFEVTDLALWDGRSSLGGVWIAHPDVIAPRAVVIRRVDTGTMARGMLYRRAREVPGTAFQLSAAAAVALAMQAGTPYRVQAAAR